MQQRIVIIKLTQPTPCSRLELLHGRWQTIVHGPWQRKHELGGGEAGHYKQLYWQSKKHEMAGDYFVYHMIYLHYFTFVADSCIRLPDAYNE